MVHPEAGIYLRKQVLVVLSCVSLDHLQPETTWNSHEKTGVSSCIITSLQLTKVQKGWCEEEGPAAEKSFGFAVCSSFASWQSEVIFDAFCNISWLNSGV